MTDEPYNGWNVIHELHIARRRACVCVHTATVVVDARRATPYHIEDCIVGHVVEITDEHFELAGASFTTRVAWEDVVQAWPRENAPEPCPHCGI